MIRKVSESVSLIPGHNYIREFRLLFAELINFIKVDLQIVELASQFMILILPILWRTGCLFLASD